ncbi:MAG: hypothetical protein ACLUDS_10590 [Acutalibacteraceae bacterium]
MTRESNSSASFEPGDFCLYAFGKENKSKAVVEVVKVLDDPRGVAQVKFHRVLADDTGNGLFNYLRRTGDTMNASFEYLKKLPRKQVKKRPSKMPRTYLSALIAGQMLGTTPRIMLVG